MAYADLQILSDGAGIHSRELGAELVIVADLVVGLATRLLAANARMLSGKSVSFSTIATPYVSENRHSFNVRAAEWTALAWSTPSIRSYKYRVPTTLCRERTVDGTYN